MVTSETALYEKAWCKNQRAQLVAEFDAELAGLVAEKGDDHPDLPFVKVLWDITTPDIESIARLLEGTVGETDLQSKVVDRKPGSDVSIEFFPRAQMTRDVIVLTEGSRRPWLFDSETVVVKGPNSVSLIRDVGTAGFRIFTATPHTFEVTTDNIPELLKQPLHAKHAAKAVTIRHSRWRQ